MCRSAFYVRAGQQTKCAEEKGLAMSGGKVSKLDFSGPVAIIRVNRLYHSGIGAEELYDITRAYWKTNRKKAEQCDLVLSAYKGEVKEVYMVEKWLDGNQIKTKYNHYRAESYGFNGCVAKESIRNKFLGASVKHFFRHGDRTPVRVFNLP